jgi:hypothetical protein
MGAWRTGLVLSGAVLAVPTNALAHGWGGPAAGSLVSVDVAVDGRESPLYPAPDGSGRFYLQAREGSTYEVRLANRSGERIGVVLVVDGLNAISGERATVASSANRMYVLGPWDETSVRGWRTSLSDVRRFTFVDERASYAARSEKANGRMGWIEVGVFRERQREGWVSRPWWTWPDRDAQARAGSGRGDTPPPASGPPAAQRTEPGPSDQAESKSREEAPGSLGYGGRAQSYPGTGWGDSAYDPAQVVRFTPEPRPAEIVTLRYEYASGLRALGILPSRPPYRDRLDERERGQWGYARPPQW